MSRDANTSASDGVILGLFSTQSYLAAVHTITPRGTSWHQTQTHLSVTVPLTFPQKLFTFDPIPDNVFVVIFLNIYTKKFTFVKGS